MEFTRLKELIWGKDDTVRAKLFLLGVDKLVFGLFIALSLLTYNEIQGRREGKRQAQAAMIQRNLDTTLLAVDLYPMILDETTSVVSRGLVLSSARTADLIPPHAALELVFTLYGHGLPDSYVRLIADASLPAGLGAVARHGMVLKHKLGTRGRDSLASQITEVSTLEYVPSPDLPEELRSVVKERMLWNSILHQMLSSANYEQVNEITTKEFLTEHMDGLFFLMEYDSNPDNHYLDVHVRILELIGLDKVILNRDDQSASASFVENEFSSADLTKKDDIDYVRAIVRVLTSYGKRKNDGTYDISPSIAPHLARLLVDKSFFHRLGWIEKDAGQKDREEWMAELPAAISHSSLQFEAAMLLEMMNNTEMAEDVLVSFMEEFMDDIRKEDDKESLSLMSNRYGSYSIRHAVSILSNIDTQTARDVIDQLCQLHKKFGHFEGVMMELETSFQDSGTCGFLFSR